MKKLITYTILVFTTILLTNYVNNQRIKILKKEIHYSRMAIKYYETQEYLKIIKN